MSDLLSYQGQRKKERKMKATKVEYTLKKKTKVLVITGYDPATDLVTEFKTELHRGYKMLGVPISFREKNVVTTCIINDKYGITKLPMKNIKMKSIS